MAARHAKAALDRRIAEQGISYNPSVMQELSLRVTCYLNQTDKTGKYWLPRDMVGADGKTLIVYQTADDRYSINGWQPWHDGMFGGRYTSPDTAMAWVRTAREIRAGSRSHF